MAMYNMTPPPEGLRDRLYYRDGDLWWSPDYKTRHINYEKPIGFIHKNGHKTQRISYEGVGRNYRISRLIWWVVNNEWPEEIDHIDCNPLNNNIENLRVANRSQNARNKRSYKNSDSKYVGVYFVKETKKWCAKIQVGKKQFCFYGYACEETAALARDIMSLMIYGDFCQLNVLDKILKITKSAESEEKRQEIHRQFLEELQKRG